LILLNCIPLGYKFTFGFGKFPKQTQTKTPSSTFPQQNESFCVAVEFTLSLGGKCQSNRKIFGILTKGKVSQGELRARWWRSSYQHKNADDLCPGGMKFGFGRGLKVGKSTRTIHQTKRCAFDKNASIKQ